MYVLHTTGAAACWAGYMAVAVPESSQWIAPTGSVGWECRATVVGILPV